MTASPRNSTEKSRRSQSSATLTNPSSKTTTPITAGFPVQPTASDEDSEDDLDNPVPGWPKVALRMANTPDFAAFSRFRDLNIKSLLYYQAELTRLRARLHRAEVRDYQNGSDEAREYANRADYLIDSEKLDAKSKKQWELVKRMRVVLKEYSMFGNI